MVSTATGKGALTLSAAPPRAFLHTQSYYVVRQQSADAPHGVDSSLMHHHHPSMMVQQLIFCALMMMRLIIRMAIQDDMMIAGMVLMQ